MPFERDVGNQGVQRKVYEGTCRPIWNGPIPDRYYYVVCNKPINSGSSHVVLFSEVDPYGYHMRQLATRAPLGDVSLVESDIPLPESADCKKLAHSKVDGVRDLLFNSHDQKSTVVNPGGKRVVVKGRPVTDKELFI